MAGGDQPTTHPPPPPTEEIVKQPSPTGEVVKLDHADYPIPSSENQPTSKPSFANILRSNIEVQQDMVAKETSYHVTQPPLPELKPTTMKDGNPSVVFKVSDKNKYINKMKHVLIGKFSHGRPAIGLIKEFFVGLQLKGEYNVSLYDTKHLFIECTLLEDFTKLWMRTTWYVKGFAMHMFKWTPDFNPQKESPLSPVWVHFDGLPLYLFDNEALFSIANSIGSPLRIDQNNINRVKLGQASEKVWIAFEKEDTDELVEGFWQPVTYDEYPAYCSGCYHLGHTIEACKRKVEVPIVKESNTISEGVVEAKNRSEDSGNNGHSKRQFRHVPPKRVYRKVVKPPQAEPTKEWAARVFGKENTVPVTPLSNSFAALGPEEELVSNNMATVKQSNILDASSFPPPSLLSGYGLQPIQYNSNLVRCELPVLSKSVPPSPKAKDKETQPLRIEQTPLEDCKEDEVVIAKDGDLPIYE
ncbi:hypothetical protein LIER_00786 [Lithospermum erythrorhizon]|uniref:DUF4283 domain-containing protein n=1 Tax=Lithospermum erythrorhizon TaxID=34254 RepID=A0AAV3NJD2_LITER